MSPGALAIRSDVGRAFQPDTVRPRVRSDRRRAGKPDLLPIRVGRDGRSRAGKPDLLPIPVGRAFQPDADRQGLDLLQMNVMTTPIQEATMDLPIKFPSETEVILEDVARFRELAPGDRIRSIRGLLHTGARLMRISQKAEWARRFAEEDKALERRNIREFIERHAR